MRLNKDNLKMFYIENENIKIKEITINLLDKYVLSNNIYVLNDNYSKITLLLNKGSKLVINLPYVKQSS